MKQIFIILMTILFVSTGFAAKAKSLNEGLKKLSKPELDKTYKAKGLDPIIQNLYFVSMKLGAKYIKSKKNKLGQRVKDKKGQKALVRLIEATNYIEVKMQAGTLHHKGPAKLYKNFRVDMNLAIERARLTPEDKSLLKSALPNSY